GRVELKLFTCAVHGVCTQGRAVPGVACCAGCPDRRAWPMRFDERNLWPGVPGMRFNSSLLPYEGGYLLAARNGWAGSEIWLGRLDRDFRPVAPPWQLELYHGREANYGREDPRLFLHQGRVHVAYIGVVGGHAIRHTSWLYARLDAELKVQRLWYPHYPGRCEWE